MILTRRVLNRALHWGVLGITAGLGALATVIQLLSPNDCPAWVLVTVAGLGVIGTVWTAFDALRDASTPYGARYIVFLAFLAVLLQGTGGYPNHDTHRLPALIYAVGAGAVLVGFAFEVRIAIGLDALLSAGFAWGVWKMYQPLDAVLVALVQFLAGLATILVVHLLQRAAGDVERSLREEWLQRQAVERARQHSAEQQRWDGLVHDKVLGALGLAGRSSGAISRAAAAELAADAQRAWSGEVLTTGAITTTIRRYADRLGLILDLDLEGDVVELEAREALLGAIEAALTNVARHSGQRAVRVRGQLSGHAGLVVVTDTGRGFDVRTPRLGTAGIDMSICGRMARAGGSAAVASTPGQGTQVTMVLAAPDPSESVPPTAGWRMARFVPLAMTGGAAIVVHVVMGVRTAAETLSTPWLVATLAAVPLLSLGLVILPASRLSRILPLVLACSILPGLATLNLAHPEIDGWHYWFVGSMDMTIAYLALWGRPVVAFTVALAVPSGIGLAMHSRDAFDLGTLIGPSSSLIIMALAFAAVRAALVSVASYLNKAAEVTGRLSVIQSGIEEATTVATRRTQALGNRVGTMLDLLATDVELTEANRAECVRLEAEARDALVAGPLMAPGVVAAVRDCRERGAVVLLSAERLDVTGMAEFQELVVSTVERAGPGTQVRAQWRPDRARRLGTITIVGPDVPDGRGDPPELRCSLGRLPVHVTKDEDAQLIELFAAPQTPSGNPSAPEEGTLSEASTAGRGGRHTGAGS